MNKYIYLVDEAFYYCVGLLSTCEKHWSLLKEFLGPKHFSLFLLENFILTMKQEQEQYKFSLWDSRVNNCSIILSSFLFLSDGDLCFIS